MNWWIVKRRIHISWLIAALCLGIIIGIISLQSISHGLFHSISWLCVGLMLLLVALWQRRIYALVLVVLAGMLIGLYRGSIAARQLEPYQNLIGYTATVAGNVTEDPDRSERGDVLIRLGSVIVDGHSLPGRIWISSSEDIAGIQRSDHITLRGKLQEGFGNFSASIYRAEIVKVERPVPGDVALEVRNAFSAQVREVISEPEASLGIGYLTGERRTLPSELDEALQVAGLTHIIVASGYNLTILIRLTRRLFAHISKYLAAATSGGLIVGFIGVTGVSPSMSRAGLVAGLSLLAWYYGRSFHPIVLLSFVGALTLMINPEYGWGDLGWQLSFAAFAGVMILAPLLQAFFFGSKRPGVFRQILGETFAAQLATLPILVVAFSEFSNVALLANLLILPLVPLAMLLTFLSGIGAWLFQGLGEVMGTITYWLLHYMTSVAQYLANLPWALSEVKVPWGGGVLYYMALIAGCLYMWYKTKHDLRRNNLVE